MRQHDQTGDSRARRGLTGLAESLLPNAAAPEVDRGRVGFHAPSAYEPKTSLVRPSHLLSRPAYTVADAAQLAQTSARSVRLWLENDLVPGHQAGRTISADRLVVSYLQLIEVAFVASLRRAGFDLDRLRSAHRSLSETFGVEYPFADWRFTTDGVDVLTEGGENSIATDLGVVAFRQAIAARAEQLDYEDGVALRWHARGRGSAVVIDPRIAFGAPAVAGVPTRVLHDRYLAGEPVEALADDFDLAPAQVAAALDVEGTTLRAA